MVGMCGTVSILQITCADIYGSPFVCMLSCVNLRLLSISSGLMLIPKSVASLLITLFVSVSSPCLVDCLQVGTVQAPIAWRPIVQDPSTVALLFSVYERAARDGPG